MLNSQYHEPTNVSGLSSGINSQAIAYAPQVASSGVFASATNSVVSDSLYLVQGK